MFLNPVARTLVPMGPSLSEPVQKDSRKQTPPFVGGGESGAHSTHCVEVRMGGTCSEISLSHASGLQHGVSSPAVPRHGHGIDSALVCGADLRCVQQRVSHRAGWPRSQGNFWPRNRTKLDTRDPGLQTRTSSPPSLQALPPWGTNARGPRRSRGSGARPGHRSR